MFNWYFSVCSESILLGSSNRALNSDILIWKIISRKTVCSTAPARDRNMSCIRLQSQDTVLDGVSPACLVLKPEAEGESQSTEGYTIYVPLSSV